MDDFAYALYFYDGTGRNITLYFGTFKPKKRAEKTGRKMEDILADLLDDGILNFSAGSDSASNDTIPSSGINKEDLTLIPGIGKVSAKRLNMQGISTIEQISKMNDSDIMAIINSKKIDSWSDMAKKILENE